MGAVHGDMMRNIYGRVDDVAFGNNNIWFVDNAFGIVYSSDGSTSGSAWGVHRQINFAADRIVPVGKANKPRGWGALACCYLGTPAS